MLEPNFLTALICLPLSLMVLIGYSPIYRLGLPRWARVAFVGVAIVIISAFVSLSYWDVSQGLSGDNWPHIREFFGGQRVSTIRNIIYIIGCVVLLNARLLLIPKSDRSNWRWWNAWMHPREKCLLPWRRKQKG